MKRGLITWDRNVIAPEVFEGRILRVRAILQERGLPAAVVYSDLWRSNHARFLSNFMPYFNRALLIVPAEGPSTLLCGLSPRTYNWIRSVTTIEDVRPAGNFESALSGLAEERGWKTIGVVDHDQLPLEMAASLKASRLEMIRIPGSELYRPHEDASELDLRRQAANLGRNVLEDELRRLQDSPNSVDYTLAGNLERRLRRDGAEDLVVLVTDGTHAPRSPRGSVLGRYSSVSIALEYGGHWVRVTRTAGSAEHIRPIQERFDRLLAGAASEAQPAAEMLCEGLTGPYPYECRSTDPICALTMTWHTPGRRQYYGDTCLQTQAGIQLL